jgi:hypothetical protein
MYSERRRTPRFPFVAVAEITEEQTGTQIVTQVSELSLFGCYVDQKNPFAPDTIVTVKIFSEAEVFEAKAKVLYAHPNLGMGLAYHEISLRSGSVLRQWLERAKSATQSSA